MQNTSLTSDKELNSLISQVPFGMHCTGITNFLYHSIFNGSSYMHSYIPYLYFKHWQLL